MLREIESVIEVAVEDIRCHFVRDCPTRSSTVELHSYRRTGSEHPHEGPRKNKICLFHGEDGDGKESISVAEMDKYQVMQCSS